ncbi:PucR family transcriptional regulator ligand-binding domain-containing protein [Glutamicibacter sp.]|uniref:PucR family transcriptional regulator ligand-binding domain-containing protein n=1 Tax=Glutamicibacter sp. TaxID=1931995 RepID=UPI0028BF3FD3|nr:PucR family transcriptional regulator ligand-binding domain-containing protein [Glutamicibacter sp.]
MITLLQLGTALASDLEPGPSGTYSSAPLTGVHISELEDPTPYLLGGELLLTTGMIFARSHTEPLAYVQRLKDKGVRVLGVGLGPSLKSVPPTLTEACTSLGIELVVVPDQVPFQNVSRAFWQLAMRSSNAGLMDSLGTQTAMAQAAMRPDAVPAVVKNLAQSLGGWAAFVPRFSEGETVWPPSAEQFMPKVRRESQQLATLEAPSTATFELLNQPVVLYPVLVNTQVYGVLSLGPGRRLTPADRQVITTVCVLLAMRAKQREQLTESTSVLGSAVAKLAVRGQLEAARLLAEDSGLPDLPSSIRLLALRGQGAIPVAFAAESVRGLTGDEPYDLVPALMATPFIFEQDDLLIALLDAAQLKPLSQRPFDDLEDTEFQAMGLGQLTQSKTPETAAVLSTSVNGTQLPSVIHALRASVSRAPLGTLTHLGSSDESKAATWVKLLHEYSRADLVSTVTSYLRHRGTWEEAARELGLHRNTLRYRMQLVRSLIGVDVDDPDVSAHLWLALRHAEALKGN